jgi:hypothetical protein
MNRDFEEEKGIKSKISPYINDQGQSLNYNGRNIRSSRRSSVTTEPDSRNLRSRSEPRRNGSNAHLSPAPVYGSEKVEYGNMVTFDSRMRETKNINDTLREK